MLTNSMFSLATPWTASCSTSFMALVLLLLHTAQKWPNLLHSVHIFLYARHCLRQWLLLQYLLICFIGVLICVLLLRLSLHAFLTILILSQLKDKIIHHVILVRPCEVIGADMFTLNNKQYLCIVDYHGKFPIIKKTEDLSADSIILVCKIIFAEYGVPKKIMSDSGDNLILDKFKTFCKSLNI